MIPRHRPPFTFREFVATQISSASESVEHLPRSIAEQLGVAHAVLLPSARFGIWAGLKAFAPAGPVAVPVLNCSAVHEAIARSGRETQFMDCSKESFLMDLDEMPDCPVWVLSELYGHTYNLQSRSAQRPFCILDMAMTLPEPHLLQRLGPSDLGLFSFGLGKPCYAGWGGVGVTQDRCLADEIRRLVRASCGEGRPRTYSIRAGLVIGARVLAHWSLVYGVARQIQQGIQDHPDPGSGKHGPSHWARDESLGEEWSRLPVLPELRMIAHNFQTVSRKASLRRATANIYRSALCGLARVTLPTLSQGALSHFTIRVPVSERDRIRTKLWQGGIDTGIFFAFPPYCEPSRFPNAFKASQELINLPMDSRLTPKHLRAFVRIFGADIEDKFRESEFVH